MKVSVVIPAYNAEATIDETIDSVLGQSIPPDEILIMDDGSSDSTFVHLRAYKSKCKNLSIFRQPNSGVASARNFLCAQATGQLIAFLDADDVWHPNYLETQIKGFTQFPRAVAGFTGHISFRGEWAYSWGNFLEHEVHFSLIDSVNFFERYNRDTASFGSPSFCCILKCVLEQIGMDPFPTKISGADDFYIMNLLPLYGPVFFRNETLVAYRETPNSVSSNRLKSVGLAVRAFELLTPFYRNSPINIYKTNFASAFAAKRRHYAKFLMGAGNFSDARKELLKSVTQSKNMISIAKSLCLLLNTYFPVSMQCRWPKSARD